MKTDSELFNKWRFNGKFIKHTPEIKYHRDFLDALKWCNDNEIRIFQNYDELYLLWELVKSLQDFTRVYTEIGAADGGTLYMLSQALLWDSTLICIDYPGGQGGDVACLPKLNKVLDELKSQGRNINFIKGKSQDADVKNQLIKLLPNNSIDILFIDGGHKYEDVKDDYKYYGGLINEGGLIAIHDISPACDDWIEVPEFWNDLKSSTPPSSYNEFYKADCIGGIGVMFK